VKLRAKLQTEAQRESRFEEPSVTSATAMNRSGHGRKGVRADQRSVGGMEDALVAKAVRGEVRLSVENASFVSWVLRKSGPGRLSWFS
jgi:hypothetical protein